VNFLSNCAQIIIASSVVFVWVFRFENIVKEFKDYKLSVLVRSAVGASKIALSTLLIVGIWYPELVMIPALIMAFLMVCAQIAHWKVRNPWQKRLPSFLLIVLSLYSAGFHAGYVS
jgi:hypothetical protein